MGVWTRRNIAFALAFFVVVRGALRAAALALVLVLIVVHIFRVAVVLALRAAPLVSVLVLVLVVIRFFHGVVLDIVDVGAATCLVWFDRSRETQGRYR